MKNLLTILAVAGLLALAAGCDQETETVGGGEKGLQDLTIGISIPSADHGWTAGVGWWAEQVQAMYPDVNWVYATADKPEKQIADSPPDQIGLPVAKHIDYFLVKRRNIELDHRLCYPQEQKAVRQIKRRTGGNQPGTGYHPHPEQKSREDQCRGGV